MMCFVWMIVVAKKEMRRFAQGVTMKELCNYKVTSRMGGGGALQRKVGRVSGCLTGMAVSN